MTRPSLRFDPHPLNALITISNLPTQSQPVFMTPWHDITYPSPNWSHMPWRLTRKKCLSLTREWVIVPFVLSFFKVTDAYFLQGMAKGFSNERRQHHRIEYHQGDKRSIVGSRSPIFLAHIKGSVGQSWEEVSLINLRDVETRKPFSYRPRRLQLIVIRHTDCWFVIRDWNNCGDHWHYDHRYLSSNLP